MDRENAGAAIGERIEEEKPAGVSGMDTRKAFVSFRKKTIKW